MLLFFMFLNMFEFCIALSVTFRMKNGLLKKVGFDLKIEFMFL